LDAVVSEMPQGEDNEGYYEVQGGVSLYVQFVNSMYSVWDSKSGKPVVGASVTLTNGW